MDKHYQCPKFKKLLVQWIDEKVYYDRDKTMRKFGYRKGKRKILLNDIFEMIGLCMTMNMRFKTAFLNYGPKDSGKTQFYNIIMNLIGFDNISNTSLQRMGKDQFGAENMDEVFLKIAR